MLYSPSRHLEFVSASWMQHGTYQTKVKDSDFIVHCTQPWSVVLFWPVYPTDLIHGVDNISLAM